MQGKGVRHPQGGGLSSEGLHDPALLAHRGDEGGQGVQPVGVRLPPRVEELTRPLEPQPTIPASLDPVEFLEQLHDVVDVAQTDADSPPQLLEAPRPIVIHQERPDDARCPGREEALEGPAGRADVGLPLFLDQDVVKGEVAVSGQIDVATAVLASQRRRMGADVGGRDDGLGSSNLSLKPPEVSDGFANVSRLPDWTHLADQRLGFRSHLEPKEQINRLFPDVGVDELLPFRGLRKQGPEAIRHLLLDFSDSDHVFTCTIIFSGS